MSLLTEKIKEATKAEQKAVRIKYLTIANINETIRCWHETQDLIWKDENPQDILDALGEDAGDILDLNKEVLNYLNSILGGRRQSELDNIIAKISTQKETQTDEDGNVTIL